jgi:hypothetical protein
VNRLAQEAVIAGLARRLADHGSWSGETHLQKATYLLRQLCGVPFDFEFILYKHGPYSFELSDELGSMRADRLLERQLQPPPYGPKIVVTDRGHDLEQRFARTMSRYSDALDWVSDQIGSSGVAELECLATALWVTNELGKDASLDKRIERLIELKPHVTESQAETALDSIEAMLSSAIAVS